jgi:hypothetical protein
VLTNPDDRSSSSQKGGVVAWILVVTGIAATVYNTYYMWVFAIAPIVDAAHPVDAHRHQMLVRMALGYMTVTSVFLGMIVTGVGIALRRGWARPWIVATSLITLCISLWPPSHPWQVVTEAWRMAWGILHVALFARFGYLVVPPMTAMLALGWFVFGGRRSLPSTPRVQWVIALLWTGAVFGIVIW